MKYFVGRSDCQSTMVGRTMFVWETQNVADEAVTNSHRNKKSSLDVRFEKYS